MTVKRKALENFAQRVNRPDNLDGVMYGNEGLYEIPQDILNGIDESNMIVQQVEVVREVEIETTIQTVEQYTKVGRFVFYRTGLQIQEDVSEDEWWAFFDVIGAFETSVQWIIGDALVYGEDKLHKTYDEVAARLERYRPDTLKQYAFVARRMPPIMRVAGLSFGHHQVVAQMANLTDVERSTLLKNALEHKWSVRALREKVAGALPARPPAESAAWEKSFAALEGHYSAQQWGATPPEERKKAYTRLKRLIAQMEQWGLE